MSAGRTLATLAAVAAVAGAVVVAVGMTDSAGDASEAAGAAPAAITSVARNNRALPALTAAGAPVRLGAPTASAAPVPSVAGTTAMTAPAPPPRITAPPTRVRSAATARAAAPAATHRAIAGTTANPTTAPAAARPAATAEPAGAKANKRGIALPLRYTTGAATRVITVTATSRSRTVAHLQAWYRAPGGGWLHYGNAVTAHIGAAGMTPTPNEAMSATPMGSFALTEAFGRLADPGTSLPYFRTRPSDWWISQPGRLYNTHQRCASHCAFTQGAPNEHLYYETPYYNYAVVIDYNTRNAPGGVRQGAGSAFFLHVYPPGTGPTAGCVSIPQSKLVTLLRWLRPATHPRILIGVP